ARARTGQADQLGALVAALRLAEQRAQHPLLNQGEQHVGQHGGATAGGGLAAFVPNPGIPIPETGTSSAASAVMPLEHRLLTLFYTFMSLPRASPYSTVTALARLRGLSTSVPRARAVW